MYPNAKFRKNGIANEVFTPSELRFEVTSPELGSRPQETMSDLSEDYACSRVKLLCSYGGRILPRPSDDRLRYVGGETRIITVSRDISFSELMMKMLEIHGQTLSLKYQLPDEDLDALVSVCSNEDLEIMMDEYETLPRIRVYLFSGDYDAELFSDSSGELRNSERMYLDAINGVLDPSFVKNSGSGVSDATQDWIASSMEDTLPPPIKAQPFQSSLPMEQPLPLPIPIPSQFSVLDAFPSDLFAMLSPSPPFSSTTYKDAAIPASSPIAAISPKMAFETSNAKIYPSSSSSEANSPIMKAQPYQSSLPAEQPLPVPSQSSLREAFPSDLFSALSLSLSFSSTTSSNEAVTPSTSAIPAISPEIMFETRDLQTYPSSSSSESMSPILKAQLYQSSLSVDQPLPAPSQVSLIDALSSDLVSMLSFSPPFSTSTYSTDTAIPVIPFETGDAKIYPSSSSPESSSPIISCTSSLKDEMAAEVDLPAKVKYEQTFTQSAPITIPPPPGSSEEPHLDLDLLQEFQKLLISRDDIQNSVLDQTQENSTIASLSTVSSMYGSNREHSLLERNLPPSQLTVNINDMIKRDAKMVEEVLEAWSASVAVGNSELPSASSIFSDQVSTAPLPDLLFVSPAIETGEQHKVSDDGDLTSEPLWMPSEGTTYKETATCLNIEPFKLPQESLLKDNSLFLEQLVTRENTPGPLYQPVDSLVVSPLPNILNMGPLVADTASSLRPQKLQQQESMYLFVGQQPKLDLPEEQHDSREPVVLTAKQGFSSGDMLAQQENLINLDMQSHKHDLDMLSVQSTRNMQNTRIEQPNYLDAEFHQTTAASQVFSSRDISSQSASPIGLGFDVIIEQKTNSGLPDDLYFHPLVTLPHVKISETQNLSESVDLLGDSKFTSTTVSNDISLLESCEAVNVEIADASKSSEKPISSGQRIFSDFPEDEVSQLSAELDKLENLLVSQGCRVANVKTNEVGEKIPGHPQILPEPSTNILFDLLTSPANVPLQLLTPSVTNTVTTTTLSKSNFPETEPILVPDLIDMNLPLDQNISLGEAVSKTDNSSVAIDSSEQLEQTGKTTTTVGLQESFSFSAGPFIEPGKPEKTVVQNPRTGKNINEVDPRELEVVAETNLELEYESVHASLAEEAISIRSSVTASAAELEAIARGLQIIRYADLEERRELGSGTYGTVYHGKWRGSDVAIKRIKASCFTGLPSEQERLKDDFWREACILSQLHHPNVVAFYGVVPDGPGGTLATVTEYMANGSLKQFLIKNDKPLDRRRRFIIAMDASCGMEYLHGKNIVHFDLKCDNLLVNMRDPRRPICKVGDLGLSKVKHQTLVSGGVSGTLPYMAPELLNGNSSKVCVKVDVFSFGIVMWELLTGREPYDGLHYGAIIGGIVSNSLRPTVPDCCDPSWRSLMERCWVADPLQRPSFTEITSELRAMGTSQLSRVRVQNQV